MLLISTRLAEINNKEVKVIRKKWNVMKNTVSIHSDEILLKLTKNRFQKWFLHS